MDHAEEVVPFGLRSSSEEWIRDQLRPTESQRQLSAAVVLWCCGSDPEVRAAMEGAEEWLESGVWTSWVEKCAKVRASETKGSTNEENGARGGVSRMEES